MGCAKAAEPSGGSPAPSATRSPDAPARIGDPAPRLESVEWVQGDPIELTNSSKIFVIEFCGALTRTSEIGITNLSHLQAKYRDIGVVAVAVCDEPAELLRSFVKTQATKINYTVASETSQASARTYMEDYRLMLFPSAFIVGKGGKVLWYGHPLRGMEDALEQLKTGQYTTEWATKVITDRKQMEVYLNLASRNDPSALQIGRRLLSSRTNDSAGLLDLAFRIASDGYIEKRDVPLANEALDRAASLSPTNAFRVAWTRAILAFMTGKEQDGLAQASKALKMAKNPDDVLGAKKTIHAMEFRM